jgi:hypothetical protein
MRPSISSSSDSEVPLIQPEGTGSTGAAKTAASNRYSFVVTVIVPITGKEDAFYLYRDKVKVKVEVTESLKGIISYPWNSGPQDPDTFRLTVVASCERCADQSILAQQPSSPNGLARQCFPSELVLFPDEETILVTPLALGGKTAEAILTFLLPERPRKPKLSQGSSRCSDESLV